MQKNSLRQKIQRKEKWCHKMEKKLAVIVDNKEEVTTGDMNTELCSSACDVAMETCSSQSHDTCRNSGAIIIYNKLSRMKRKLGIAFFFICVSKNVYP